MVKNYTINDDVLYGLEWESLGASDLLKELVGSCILGTETVTDGIKSIGVVLYAEKRSGDVTAVEMLWDDNASEFLISKADIPNL